MADGWEPANELEQRLLDAMQRGEQDRYFQVLNETALLLPVPMDANGQPAPGGWATWAYEGRTYLLAFTSQQAMVATLGQYAGEFRTAHLADISANWPDESWWLAIDFGLPIAGYLPAAFVSQITGGGAAQSGQPDQYPAQDQQEQYAPADPQAPYAPTEQQAPYAPAEQQAPQDQYQPAGEGQPPTAEAVSGDAAWAPPQ
ncbi:MAG: SseB family protein, partial [Actinocatenispora sp.]